MDLVCKQNHTRVDGISYAAGDTYNVLQGDLRDIYVLGEEHDDVTWENFADIFDVEAGDTEALRLALGNLRIIEPGSELPF